LAGRFATFVLKSNTSGKEDECLSHYQEKGPFSISPKQPS